MAAAPRLIKALARAGNVHDRVELLVPFSCSPLADEGETIIATAGERTTRLTTIGGTDGSGRYLTEWAGGKVGHRGLRQLPNIAAAPGRKRP